MRVQNVISSCGKLLSGWVLSRWRPSNVASFHLGRSGSRLLGDLLKQHPRVVWEGELFSPGRLDGIAGRWPVLTRDRMSILKLRMQMAGRIVAFVLAGFGVWQIYNDATHLLDYFLLAAGLFW